MPSPSTLLLTPRGDTDAAFRAWGSPISAAIATAGCVQTADTGQINWATVTAPAFNAIGGYEIWRFNDSLQSTAPIFFKIEYASVGGSGLQRPSILSTVGTGSNGSGTITGTNISGVTGALAAQLRIMQQSGSDGIVNAAANVYVNGDGSALLITGWLSKLYSAFLLLIERSRNWDGTPNGDGFTVTTAQGGSAAGTANGVATHTAVCYLPSAVSNAMAQSTGFFIDVPAAGSGLAPLTCVVASTLYPRPLMSTCSPRAGAPSQFVMAICPADYPVYQQFAMSHYGTSYTWVSGGAVTGSNDWGAWGGGNLKSFIARIS